jgi:hypothetical protein
LRSIKAAFPAIDWSKSRLSKFYAPKPIDAKLHNLTLLDKTLPMPFDSGLPEYGLEPLSATQHASGAFLYANDLHNALTVKSA